MHLLKSDIAHRVLNLRNSVAATLRVKHTSFCGEEETFVVACLC